MLSNRTAILLTVSFIEGGALMAYEIISSRIYTPHFGGTVYVWTSILTITLLGLALGYRHGDKKNKETVQDGNTNLMMFSPDDIIAFVSQYFTLRVGDLIFTGTPKGVGKVSENDELEMFLEGEKVYSLRIQ